MPYIDRDMAIKALIDEGRNVDSRYLESERIIHESDAVEAISMLPTADVVERKVGKWTEKQVIHADEAKEVVEEWQSCRCSICGHYNTQPYMYFFTEPNYCSFCGASMKEEADNAQLD